MLRHLRTGFIFAIYVGSITSHAILTHISRAHGRQKYDAQLVVFCAEFIKLVVSFAVYLYNYSNEVSFQTLIQSCVPMFVPAGLYFIMNSLYYSVMENITPSAYTIVSQLKHPITAVLAFFFLKKTITKIQWQALFLCCPLELH
jgi:drug/metabolite transporter (DMT)-like permease